VKRLWIFVGVFVILFFLLPLVFWEIYRGPFPQQSSVEQWRKSVDKQLAPGFNQRTSFYALLDRVALHNLDKNFWEPPRILPVFNQLGYRVRYEVYGVVRFWDPGAKLLGINSYLGRQMFVRFDPTMNGSIGIFLPLNGYGQFVKPNTFLFVNSSDIPQWSTLFCVGDVVSIEVKDPGAFRVATQSQPLTPSVISLAQRLCKQ